MRNSMYFFDPYENLHKFHNFHKVLMRFLASLHKIDVNQIVEDQHDGALAFKSV